MTSTIQFPAHVIGLMSGTSADGVDAAILYTDGRDIAEVGPSLSVPYSDALRADILRLMQGEGNVKAAARALTQVHIDAIETLRGQTKEKISLIGFHGQTIKHDPKHGITRQIGDAEMIVKQTGISTVYDFRSRDVREGGQGAPLVPLYHAALAHRLPKPLMVVNIGGVANITWLGADGKIIAFDCGPGNALMDDWFSRHAGGRFDEDGRIAARGKIDEKRVKKFLSDPFFRAAVPKSLDRHHFSLALVEGMGFEDGIATLAVMTARGITEAFHSVPVMPTELLITGGGRHNITLMRLIQNYGTRMLGGKTLKVLPVDDVGWDGDMLEAQAFAYLAARSVQGLALSLPMTTGVPRPVTGGAFYPA